MDATQSEKFVDQFFRLSSFQGEFCEDCVKEKCGVTKWPAWRDNQATWKSFVEKAHLLFRGPWRGSSPAKTNPAIVPSAFELQMNQGFLEAVLAEVTKDAFIQMNLQNNSKLSYVHTKIQVRFSLAYCLLMQKDEEAETMYARAMNELLELLHADPARPDHCFAVFSKAVYDYHIGYHVVKGGIVDKYPCIGVIQKYLLADVVKDQTIANNVLTLVPLQMSKPKQANKISSKFQNPHQQKLNRSRNRLEKQPMKTMISFRRRTMAIRPRSANVTQPRSPCQSICFI